MPRPDINQYIINSYANPLRPVTWRWNRAREIVDGTGLPTTQHRDGPTGHHWIKRAVKFLKEDAKAVTPRAQAALAEKTPDIFWAYHIWSSSTNLQRYSIEAYILARMDAWTLARECRVATNVIRAFEALFFNVADSLGHTLYIVNCVFGPSVHMGLTTREYDVLWKLYAYFLGPAVLTALINKFATVGWCPAQGNVDATFKQDAAETLAVKSAIAAKTLQVTDRNQIRILEVFTKFVEIERLSGGANSSESQILSGIQAMMGEYPLTLAGKFGNAQLQNPQVAAIERGGAQLSNEELLVVGAGGYLDYEPAIRNLTFEEIAKTPV